MKAQLQKPSEIQKERALFDICYLALPLLMAVIFSVGAALLPPNWLLGFLGCVVFVGLLIALTHHN